MPGRNDVPLRVSAKTDYALRAAAELAGLNGGGLVKAEQIAQAQAIPVKFLLTILAELSHRGIVRSQRGSVGGYRLARPADQITLADVIRAVDGEVATIREALPRQSQYAGPAEGLRDAWLAVEASRLAILDRLTLADLVRGSVPAVLSDLATWQGSGRRGRFARC